MPAAGIQLHKADAALNEPPRDQALPAEMCRRNGKGMVTLWQVQTVKAPRLFILRGNVQGLGGRGMKLVGQVVAGDPCAELGVGLAPAPMHLVETVDHADLGPLH